MTATPDAAPTEIRAGDTLIWRRDLALYPASEGWELKYTLVTATAVHHFEAAADGDAFAIEVDAADTAGWGAGQYQLTERVEKAGQRFTLASTPLRVLPDLASLSEGLDVRSHARKVLDLVNAWLETKAPTVGAFELAGRKISNYPLTELLALRDRYAADVAREEAAARGRPFGRVLTRL